MSFRWGHVVTINVSPEGAAAPACEDAPRRRPATPCPRTTAPKARRRHTSPLSCKASCGQPIPKSVAATPAVIPYVRTAEPWIRRRRTLPSLCHSLRTVRRAGARRERTSAGEYGPRGCRPRTSRCILEPRAPSSSRPSPTTGTFHAAGCVSSRAGAFDAVGDSNPVPQRAGCPRPHKNVPARAGCPRPRHLSAGCSCPVPRHRCGGRASIAATRLPRQGVTRLLAVTRMAPVIYCTRVGCHWRRVGCHWRRVGCTPGRWGLRAVRTTPGQ